MATAIETKITDCLQAEYRLVLLNLLHDDRITDSRKAEVDKFLTSMTATVTPGKPEEPVASARLGRVIRKYWRQRVAVSGGPDYISSLLNGNNFVPMAKPGSKDGIHPDTLLAHVVDLSMYAKTSGYSLLPGFPGTGVTQDEVIDWLKSYVPAFPDKTVPGRSSAEVEGFIDRALKAIHDYDTDSRPPPVWVTIWDQFNDHVDDGPSMWMKLLGMRDSARSGPRYPIVLVYRADSVGPLVRPTQLEAEFNAFHFPSPRNAPLTDGGYTMDWSKKPGYREPLSEFVHQQKSKPYTKTDWILGGRLCGPTTPGGARLTLNAVRRRHYGRLTSKVGPLPGGWMRDVTCLA